MTCFENVPGKTDTDVINKTKTYSNMPKLCKVPRGVGWGGQLLTIK